ncbi:hypothetical protein [Agrococcus jejuensis]|uniref:Uncharacterized protein n=1 Tax=Agrococcus jejuensis TaxID=399736 RepID=A0A1G8FW41_9MICO|nr:hypothetical protein [Agrococcus jejuensis]SDH86186.1 hypothetical protein SAMN04489720_2637 [Agrococcus jejuensis]
MTLLDERETSASNDVAMSPQERKARRARIRRWIFPAVSLVVIIGVVVTTVLLMNSGITEDRPPTADEISADNTSQMTDAGRAYIAQRQTASFNLSDLPLTADEVGMADDDTVVASSSIGLIQTTFFVGRGGGIDGEGYFRSLMRQMTVTTEGGVVTSIAAELDTFGWAEFPAIVRAMQDGTTQFGWEFTPAMQAQLEDEVGAAVRDGESYATSFDAGTAMGIPVGAEVACDGGGNCSLVYVLEPTEVATGS